MKAAIATGWGEVDDNIFVKEDWPRPKLPTTLDEALAASAKSNKKGYDAVTGPESYMLIKVHACALAPGDCRLLTGKTDKFQLPQSGRPYVVGSDVAGEVVETHPSEEYFQVGDKVVSRFDEPQPNGGCAEYRLVKTSLSEKAPETISAVEACTLPASAMAAKNVAQQFVKNGDRVLILGGSGGVGTFLCQYVKLQGASFVAATTTQAELVKGLGVDRAIDYQTENWWQVEEFQGDGNLDVVIDLVNGNNWQRGACSGKALKRKARYVQLLSGVETEIDISNTFAMMRFMAGMMGRTLVSKCHPNRPTWHVPEALELQPGFLKELFQDIDQKRIRVVLDPASPFPFTQEGVRSAMSLQKSIHAHGKVVIKIVD